MTSSPDRPRSSGESIGVGADVEVAEVPADLTTAPAGAVTAAEGRVPDFFIVGHQKCGTTALYLMLRSHPQVFMSDVKEPRFFASDQRSRLASQAPSSLRPRTLDAYLALFAGARPDQRVGEASPQYLRSAVAAADIASLQPAARIVAILREPASYLRSFHQQMVSSNVETQSDFRKAMALEDARREGRRIPRRCHHPEALLYSDHVRYVEQLRRYHAAFGRDQVLVLVYEDFRRDNEATVRRVLRFLEVDDGHPIESTDTNKVKAIRSRPLHHLANAGRRARRNPDAAGAFAHAVNALTPRFTRSEGFRRCWRRVVYTSAPAPDEEFMLELRERFKPEVRTLSEYLNRDLLGAWGYDGGV
jgi:Sulfotransferase family